MLEVGSAVVGEVERILRSGRMRKLKVKLVGRTLAELPLSLTAAGALALAGLAVLLSQLSFEVETEGASTLHQEPPDSHNA